MSSPITSDNTSIDDEISKPLWKYVTKYDRINEGGGNISWQCNFCHQQKNSSYTKVRAHLLKLSGFGIGACKNVTTKDISEMQKLDDEAKIMMKNNEPKRVPLPGERISIGTATRNDDATFHMMDQKKRKIGALEKAFNMTSREQLDSEIARLFYTGGVSFNLAKNPYYVSSYSIAANSHLSGYVPPGYNKLRTTLLQKEKRNVERLLQPIKST